MERFDRGRQSDFYDMLRGFVHAQVTFLLETWTLYVSSVKLVHRIHVSSCAGCISREDRFRLEQSSGGGWFPLLQIIGRFFVRFLACRLACLPTRLLNAKDVKWDSTSVTVNWRGPSCCCCRNQVSLLPMKYGVLRLLISWSVMSAEYLTHRGQRSC